MRKVRFNESDIRYYVEARIPDGRVVDRYYIDQCVPRPRCQKCVKRNAEDVMARLRQLDMTHGLHHRVVRIGPPVDEVAWLRGGMFYPECSRRKVCSNYEQQTIDLTGDRWPDSLDGL